MPNIIASFALLVWPIVIYLFFRYLPPSKALICTILGAYLLLPPLPAGFDFPLLPPLNKETLPNLIAFLIFVFVLDRKRDILPKSGITLFLIAVFVLTPIATVLTNREPVLFIAAGLPGLRWTDAIALSINQAILLLGYLMARSLLATADAHRDLLVALFMAGMVYSLPMLFEIRLSPQLNLWIYGFHQHLFEQAMRGDGFRPLVFLYHGIWAAFFVMTTAIAGLALWRNEAPVVSSRYLFAAIYLLIVLVLCKTLGALLFAILLVPLIMFAAAKTQLRFAVAMVFLALAYPALKGVDFIPTNIMLDAASKVSGDRAHSLAFRFDNEVLLRDRAAEKPLFGWGSWGRNHLHDPVDGTITTISDGRWIITLGVFGWFGFIAEFGLLGLPMLLLWREVRHLPSNEIPPYLGPLALLLAVNLVDLIPNATLTTMTWLLAGSLLGHAELLARRRRKTSPVTVAAPKSRTVI